MDRRLILSIIILLASVLLLSGLMNFQAGSAEEAPGDEPGPVIEEPETVTQKADPAPAKQQQATSNESGDDAPDPEPTMMSFGGGGFGSAAATEEKPVTTTSTGSVSVSSVPTVEAYFTVELNCTTLTANFTDMSENASSLSWDFGDGNSSELEDPVHEYGDVGPYTVNLTATGSDKSTDSFEMVIDFTGCTDGDDEETRDGSSSTQEIPEFPTIAIPVAAIIGMAFFFSRKQ